MVDQVIVTRLSRSFSHRSSKRLFVNVRFSSSIGSIRFVSMRAVFCVMLGISVVYGVADLVDVNDKVVGVISKANYTWCRS